MAALTADRVTKSKGKLRRASYPVAASTTIYAGAMVCINTSGYAVPAADTLSFSDVVGVATAKQDNSSGSNGDISVIVEYGGAFLIDAAAGIDQTNVGRDAVVTDDQTVTDAAAGTNDIVVGRILEFVDETQNKVWVNIDNT